MNKNSITFIVHTALALLMAVVVWEWLRYALAFWRSDSLYLIEYLLESLGPLKRSFNAFIVFVIPGAIVVHLVQRNMPEWIRIVSYVFIGIFFSMLYLLSISKLSVTFIFNQVWVYVAAGGLAGLVCATILELPFAARYRTSDKEAVSQARRKVLGSFGLTLGAAGFLGALAGPFHFWRNRDTHVDVNISRLKEGQMMTVEVANKPIWILRRTPNVIRLLKQDDSLLLDPQSEHSQQPEQARNSLRSIRPDYFVVYGVCTHLGCSPTYLPEGMGNPEMSPSPDPQFFCPCHGGTFDLAGRVYKGTPPPVNMVVPEHTFVSKDVIRFYFPSLVEEWHSTRA